MDGKKKSTAIPQHVMPQVHFFAYRAHPPRRTRPAVAVAYHYKRTSLVRHRYAAKPRGDLGVPRAVFLKKPFPDATLLIRYMKGF